MNISKQTNLIVKQVLGNDNVIDIDKLKKLNVDVNSILSKNKTYTTYVPHGIDKTVFKPVDTSDKDFILFKKKVLRNKLYKYIVFYNNRNIRRKCTTNLMASFKFFVDQLPLSLKKNVLLYLHTTPSDMHGTNLIECHKRMLPLCLVIILGSPYSPQQLNYLYNIASVTAGVSSALGFGLATALSLMAGTPIIATVTGGLQDQMGLKDNNELYVNSILQPSKQDGLIQLHGKWVFPIIPELSLLGSPPTPYIYDSRATMKDIALGILYWYNLGLEKRKQYGNLGRLWMVSELSMLSSNIMNNKIIYSILLTLNKFIPQDKFTLTSTRLKMYVPLNKGIYNPVTKK